MEYTIELALPTDAQQMLEYLKYVGAETDNLSFGSEGISVSVQEEEAFIRSMNQNGNALFVAKRGGTIIATISVSRFLRRMSHRAELGISVLKSEWGKGIGSELMRRAIEHAKTNGLEILSLEVRSDNCRAIGLYEKYGFEKIGTFPCHSKINGQFVDYDMMILKLN